MTDLPIEPVLRGRQLERGRVAGPRTLDYGEESVAHVAKFRRWKSSSPINRVRPLLIPFSHHRPTSWRQKLMLSTQTLDLAFDDDSWNKSFISTPTQLYRASSVGSYGVTSMGRGFQWDNTDTFSDPILPRKDTPKDIERFQDNSVSHRLHSPTPIDKTLNARPKPALTVPQKSFTTEPLSMSPASSRPHSPALAPSTSSSPRLSARVSPVPRPRRRSSQQRVSLIAGRVSIAPAESPSLQAHTPRTLLRTGSTSSFLSVAESTAAPPSAKEETFLGGRNITEFVIEGEIGRGAYGLVKRAREIQSDGSFGPPLVIKQVIKSRILADCWKKHPRYGTIPIEIYVMSAVSNTSYVLPPRRPWDPSRFGGPTDDEYWVEGKTVKGHPNICPLLDFFEDDHYYYLVLPSTTPEHIPNQPPPPSDLFDLVEAYPKGLPPDQIRSYLGQLADAVHFLHSHGIVHRDLKDENVVLGKAGRCVLIDFGSSGLVKRGGWDTFSGTLDYAGPEILRGERYQGKEQDVWAFGVVAYVLLVGECPFQNAEEAQDGLQSPFSNASIALDERCGDEHEMEGLEADGGGALGDAAALVRACLQVQVSARPTFEKILQCRFLNGKGWGV